MGLQEEVVHLSIGWVGLLRSHISLAPVHRLRALRMEHLLLLHTGIIVVHLGLTLQRLGDLDLIAHLLHSHGMLLLTKMI